MEFLKDLKTWKTTKPIFLLFLVFSFPQLSGDLYLAKNRAEIWKESIFVVENSALISSGLSCIFSAVCFSVVDRCNRKLLLLLSSVCMFLSMILFGILHSINEIPSNWRLFALVLFDFGHSFGYGPIAYILLGEMLPRKSKCKCFFAYRKNI